MVIAVLARHGGPSLAGSDVFVNVAGGVRVDEPGADLAVALALASAHRGEPLRDADGRPLACFGEIGLTGELRGVAHADRRIAEASKFGLAPVLGPAASERTKGLTQAATLRDALRQASRTSAASAPGRASQKRPRARTCRGRRGLTSANPTSPHGITRTVAPEVLLSSSLGD